MVTELTLGPASVLWTGGADGHLGHNPPRRPHDDVCCGAEAQARRDAVRSGPWINLTQVHGNRVVVADADTQPGEEADAIVSDHAGLTLAIATADCAPIALSSPEGVIGAVHAGWAGLYAGVIGNAVDKMRELGATRVAAALGPCIHVGCYEFGEEPLVNLMAKWGREVQGSTSMGTPAFDLGKAVAVELDRSGATLEHVDKRCTACSGEYFSHRTTGTTDRQVMLVTQ